MEEAAFQTFLLDSRRALLAGGSLGDQMGALCRAGAVLGGLRVTRGSPAQVVAEAGRSAPRLWEDHCFDSGRVYRGDAAPGVLFVQPLRVAGRLWGCMTLVADELPPARMAALEELALDVERAIGFRERMEAGQAAERFVGDLASLVPGAFYKVCLGPSGVKFLYISPGVDLLLPLTPERILANAGEVFGAVHPADRRRLQAAVLRSRDFLTVFSLEFRLIRPNGAVVWVLASAFPQTEGDTTVWTGTATDVTSQNRLAETLERLRQSEKLESIGLLAGGIAHEFNNLLTGIFGFVQLARMSVDKPEKVVAHLDNALAPFQRAQVLTQQLVMFGKGGGFTKSAFRLDEFLPPVARLALGERFVWVPGSEACVVTANEKQIRQIFEALFLNAVQAGATQVRVVLTLQASVNPDRGLPSGPFVETVVEDNGAGVPSELATKIFDPFFTTKTAASGLGLSLAYAVATKHGGLLTYEPAPSGGALFRVFLPATPAAKSE